MTYDQALDWLIDNVPMELFDNYEDWYNACRKEITTENLWNNSTFNNMHKNYWINNKDQEETTEPVTEPNIQPEIEQVSKREIEPPQRTFYREPIQYQREVIYTSEQNISVPATESAPVVTTVKYDMTPPQPQRKESFFKRIFRNPFKRSKDNNA